MGIPSLLDAIVLAPAAILGLLGIWLGFGRSLVAWPMRWLVPLLGACLAALPAAAHLTVYGGMGLLDFSVAVVTIALGAMSFLVTAVLLVMFMRNLRDRMTVWTRSRSIGVIERIVGALFGIACGVLLAAFPCALYESLRPDPERVPAWARDSVSLAYFRGASEAVRSAVSEYLPPAPGAPRR